MWLDTKKLYDLIKKKPLHKHTILCFYKQINQSARDIEIKVKSINIIYILIIKC